MLFRPDILVYQYGGEFLAYQPPPHHQILKYQQLPPTRAVTLFFDT